MRYIEIDSIIEQIKAEHCERCKHDERCALCDIDEVLILLEEADDADVEEVVRCKDCKYQDDCAGQMVHTTRDYVLEQNVSTYNKVDFCSYGERKEK